MSDVFKQLEEIIYANNIVEGTSLAEALADIGSPTTSIAVLDGGNITSRCFTLGQADTDTVFQACSISKPVAGFAVMKLIELGHFSLNDGIYDRLPREVFDLLARDKRTTELLKTVTVKHLMSHTSGLSIHGFPGYPDHDNVPTSLEILEGRLRANTQPVKMETLPGLDFMYSGGGIEVLRLVVEHTMQMPFPDIMQKYVFQPLNMTRSFYQLPREEKNVAHAHYHGYYPAPANWHLQPEVAAAGLWTTPSDLLRVVRAIQQSIAGTISDSDPILNKESAQQMLTLVKQEMALTWFATRTLFHHGGSNNPGYRTFVFGFGDLPWNDPSKVDALSPPIPLDCGVAIMTNAEMGDRVISKIIPAISYLKRWPEPPVRGATEANMTAPFTTTAHTKQDVDVRGWLSNHWSDGWVTKRNERGELVAGRTGLVLVRLLPAAIPAKELPSGEPSIDFVLEGIDIMLRFCLDGEDKVIELHNHGTSKVSTLRRMACSSGETSHPYNSSSV